jgi:hypothetical protein
MKDLSTVSNKNFRNLIYPKKRPSPNGISKSRKSTPSFRTSRPPQRVSPLSAKAALVQQRQRELHIPSIRREGPLLEDEYRDDIRYYMHDMEVRSCRVHLFSVPLSSRLQRYTSPSITSMDQQPEIRWHMRPCLVDFLVEIHFTFRLRPETLYLALNIVDRYVSRRIVYIKHYQLVGCAALWIAAKFEDAKERVPTVQDLTQICRNTYDESAFIQMEGHLLSTIQWSLGHPTAEAWLRLLCCGPIPEDAKVQHVARFLMEITLFHREFVKFTPSSIALGALTLARAICGKSRRPCEETEASREVVDLLDNRLAKHVNDISEALIKKYSYAFYSKASTFVVHYYLHGGRFTPTIVSPIPTTPTHSPVSNASTPTSVSTSTSDWSDDGPLTPSTPLISTDITSGLHIGECDKENMPSALDPVIIKHKTESSPDQYHSQDAVVLTTRPALHPLNIASPRVVA